MTNAAQGMANNARRLTKDGRDLVQIRFSEEVYRRMLAFITSVPNTEIGWLGSVQEPPEGQSHIKVYVVDHVFVAPQDVSGGHTEMTSRDLMELYNELAPHTDVAKRIRLWGHVHPGEMNSPSWQDDKQMEIFSNCEYFIRVIFTRSMRYHICLFDYKNNIVYENCSWMVDTAIPSEMLTEVEKEVHKKVRFSIPSKTKTSSSVPSVGVWKKIANILTKDINIWTKRK